MRLLGEEVEVLQSALSEPFASEEADAQHLI